MKVDVYGAGDEAEFIRNGKSLGRKPIEKLMASMDIPYEPGILEGIVYKDGAEISRSTLVTPEEAAVLELIPEEKKLCGRRQGSGLCQGNSERCRRKPSDAG